MFKKLRKMLNDKFKEKAPKIVKNVEAVLSDFEMVVYTDAVVTQANEKAYKHTNVQSWLNDGFFSVGHMKEKDVELPDVLQPGKLDLEKLADNKELKDLAVLLDNAYGFLKGKVELPTNGLTLNDMNNLVKKYTKERLKADKDFSKTAAAQYREDSQKAADAFMQSIRDKWKDSDVADVEKFKEEFINTTTEFEPKLNKDKYEKVLKSIEDVIAKTNTHLGNVVNKRDTEIRAKKLQEVFLKKGDVAYNTELRERLDKNLSSDLKSFSKLADSSLEDDLNKIYNNGKYTIGMDLTENYVAIDSDLFFVAEALIAADENLLEINKAHKATLQSMYDDPEAGKAYLIKIYKLKGTEKETALKNFETDNKEDFWANVEKFEENYRKDLRTNVKKSIEKVIGYGEQKRLFEDRVEKARSARKLVADLYDQKILEGVIAKQDELMKEASKEFTSKDNINLKKYQNLKLHDLETGKVYASGGLNENGEATLLDPLFDFGFITLDDIELKLENQRNLISNIDADLQTTKFDAAADAIALRAVTKTKKELKTWINSYNKNNKTFITEKDMNKYFNAAFNSVSAKDIELKEDDTFVVEELDERMLQAMTDVMTKVMVEHGKGSSKSTTEELPAQAAVFANALFGAKVKDQYGFAGEGKKVVDPKNPSPDNTLSYEAIVAMQAENPALADFYMSKYQKEVNKVLEEDYAEIAQNLEKAVEAQDYKEAVEKKRDELNKTYNKDDIAKQSKELIEIEAEKLAKLREDLAKDEFLKEGYKQLYSTGKANSEIDEFMAEFVDDRARGKFRAEVERLKSEAATDANPFRFTMSAQQFYIEAVDNYNAAIELALKPGITPEEKEGFESQAKKLFDDIALRNRNLIGSTTLEERERFITEIVNFKTREAEIEMQNTANRGRERAPELRWDELDEIREANKNRYETAVKYTNEKSNDPEVAETQLDEAEADADAKEFAKDFEEKQQAKAKKGKKAVKGWAPKSAYKNLLKKYKKVLEGIQKAEAKENAANVAEKIKELDAKRKERADELEKRKQAEAQQPKPEAKDDKEPSKLESMIIKQYMKAINASLDRVSLRKDNSMNLKDLLEKGDQEIPEKMLEELKECKTKEELLATLIKVDKRFTKQGINEFGAQLEQFEEFEINENGVIVDKNEPDIDQYRKFNDSMNNGKDLLDDVKRVGVDKACYKDVILALFGEGIVDEKTLNAQVDKIKAGLVKIGLTEENATAEDVEKIINREDYKEMIDSKVNKNAAEFIKLDKTAEAATI